METQVLSLDEKKHFENLALATRSHALSYDRLDELDNYLPNLQRSIRESIPYVQPLAGAIAINVGCNSKCSYCTICDMPIDNTPIEDLLMAVDEMADLGVYNMGIAGGEPLLHPEIPKLVEHISSYYLYSYLHTNGTLWHPVRIEKILANGLNSLVLSLDSQIPEIYEKLRGIPIDGVLKNLDYVLSIKDRFPDFKLMINCVVSKVNLDHLQSLVQWCEAKDISIGFQPLHPDFWSHEETYDLVFTEIDYISVKKVFDNLINMKQMGFPINNNQAYLEGFAKYLTKRKLPDGFTCTTGYTIIQVDHKLNVKSCWYMRSMGNLHQESIKEIWKSRKYCERRAEMVSLKCPHCWMRRHTELRSEEWLEEFIQNIVNNTILCE